MNESSIPKQLLNRDIDRLRGYREYLDFYNGQHWTGRATRGEKRLDLPPIAVPPAKS